MPKWRNGKGEMGVSASVHDRERGSGQETGAI